MQGSSEKRRSLLFLLGGIVVAAVVSVEGGGAAYEYYSQRQMMVEAMRESSAQSLSRLEKNIAPFMEAYAPSEYAQQVSTEFALKEYFAIVVRDFNMGKIVGRAEYVSGRIRDAGREAQDFDSDNPAHREAIKQVFFSDTRPIRASSGELLGDVTVYSSGEALEKELQRILEHAVITAAVTAALLIGLMFFSIRRLLIVPLRRIRQSLALQDADGIPLRSPPATAMGEISTLTDTIGTMLGVIRRSRDALQLERARLANVISGANAGTWEWNVQSGELVVNERWAEMLGYTLEELAPIAYRTWADNVHPDDLRKATALIEKHFSGESPEFRVEIRMRHKSGHWIWVLAMGRIAVWNAEGKPLLMSGTHIDISESKRQEAALLDQRNRLNEIIAGTNAGTWEWNVQTGAVVFNERWAEIVGYTLAELEPVSIEAWTKLAHPDDLKRSAELLQQHFDGEMPFYEAEVRMRHKRGDWVWVLDRGKVSTWTEDGKPLLMFGTHQDITARKMAEEELRQAAIVYNASSEGIMVCDAETRILAVNRAFTALTGYEEDEAVGNDPRILKSGRQDAEFYREMWKSINETGQWRGELWNRKKCGEEFAEMLSINTIYDAEGRPYRRIGVFSDITARKQSEELIWSQANYDFLTGLPNRRLFIDRVDQEIRKASRQKGRFAVFFVDLDRFKEVNDTLGHHVGDELLKEAAGRIQKAVRMSDTVGRMGGDEFTVLLSDVHDPGASEKVAQTILGLLEQPFHLGGEEIYISGSIGIAVYPDDAQSVDELFKCADQAMYVSKEKGRNRFNFYTRSLQDAALERMDMARALRRALEQDEFEVYFQPVIEFGTGAVCKAEALIRWNHPERGLVAPNDFIPLAEELGMIHDIGDWVFRRVAQEVKRCEAYVPPDFQISLNASPEQFRKSAALRHWGDILEGMDVEGGRLCVEITESLLLDDEFAVEDTLRSLRGLGIHVAIDDFGTGYSSLSYLSRYNLDYLKIDRSFTRELAASGENMALCEAIVVMSHKLGLRVIAEGVETDRQQQLLTRIGCDYGQGYLFAKPMPAAEFENYLQGRSRH